MFEIVRWVTIGILWLCIIVNVITMVLNAKTSKQLKKAQNTVNGMIFKLIRDHGKHIVVSETDNLCDLCQNGDQGCHVYNGASCTRFLPLEGTNLTSIKGTVETPPDVDYDTFSDLFVDWIESKGWRACTIFAPYEDEEKTEETDPS